jgi:hypothetical protein
MVKGLFVILGSIVVISITAGASASALAKVLNF